jgi:hypothetical protein
MLDYLALSDQAFTKFVDGLSSEAYRSIFNSDPDFADRINSGTAWQEHRDQKDLEAYVTAELNKKRDRLNKELAAGRGLSTASWVWLDQKNLHVMSLSIPQDVKQIRPIYEQFNKKNGPFTDEERGILVTLGQQVVGVGRVLNFKDPKTWDCVFAVGIASGKISVNRTQPVPAEPALNLERAEPTAAERKLAYRNDVVFKSGSLGDLTMHDIDTKLTADQYAAIVKEGFSLDGRILIHTNDLSRRGGR